ncbi:MAG: Wzz/FepE/Etk N-terminal domain-containing protein [Pseudomonadota bacterium]|nr:Wzz/FepE/Etk N-terminal domain-containing protein [Pseudomonadota bacterium]
MSAVPQDLYNTADPAADAGKSFGDYLGILRRRRKLIAVVFAVLFAIAAVVAVVLPPVYRSTATILIKEQEIPQEFVRSTVTSFADERIQVISQQVMTRSTLLDLVDRYALYGKARQSETSEEILDRMRRDIKLTPISAEVTDRRSGSPVKSTIAFSLSYDSEVAANAQKIANELTTLYLNENVKNRQQKAAETTLFLDEELARVTEHISELEQKLSSFKARNQGRLPELNLSNQMGSERANAEIQRIDREIVFLEQRRMDLQSQLADTKPSMPVLGSGGVLMEPEDRLKALQLQLTSLTGVYSDDHPDIKRLRREIAILKKETGLQEDATDRESKLLLLQQQISLLRQKYSDDHPDVVQLKRAFAAIDRAVRTGADAPEGRADELRKARKPDNPAYITLKSQIETITSQVQSMRSERQEMRGKLELLDLRVSQTPEVEREYLELARDLDSSRGRFRELRDKQMQAQVAEQLERGRKAERFTLIEPPIFPEKPFRPNRGVIVMMGFVLALVGGVGSAALREAIDQTVHSARDVMRVMQVPVLARLPALPSPVLVKRRSRMRWIVAVCALVLFALLLAAFHNFYMPIDVAWYGLLRRVAQ